MYYETHITYYKAPLNTKFITQLKTIKQEIIAVKVINVESLKENNKGVYCVSKDRNFETVGFISNNRKAAYNIAFKYCVLPEDNNKLIYDFKALDDRKEIMEIISKDFPELLI